MLGLLPIVYQMLKLYRADLVHLEKLMKLKRNKKVYRELADEYAKIKKQYSELRKIDKDLMDEAEKEKKENEEVVGVLEEQLAVEELDNKVVPKAAASLDRVRDAWKDKTFDRPTTIKEKVSKTLKEAVAARTSPVLKFSARPAVVPKKDYSAQCEDIRQEYVSATKERRNMLERMYENRKCDGPIDAVYQAKLKKKKEPLNRCRAELGKEREGKDNNAEAECGKVKAPSYKSAATICNRQAAWNCKNRGIFDNGVSIINPRMCTKKQGMENHGQCIAIGNEKMTMEELKERRLMATMEQTKENKERYQNVCKKACSNGDFSGVGAYCPNGSCESVGGYGSGDRDDENESGENQDSSSENQPEEQVGDGDWSVPLGRELKEGETPSKEELTKMMKNWRTINEKCQGCKREKKEGCKKVNLPKDRYVEGQRVHCFTKAFYDLVPGKDLDEKKKSFLNAFKS